MPGGDPQSRKAVKGNYQNKIEEINTLFEDYNEKFRNNVFQNDEEGYTKPKCLIEKMLLKLILRLRLNTVCLGKPLTQAQDSFVDMLLKFYRVVQERIAPEGNPCIPAAVART
jgi:hypothetical protein